MREEIEARGASLMFLPAYSPDLNPIEQVFARLEQCLRSAEPGTRDTLWQTIASGLDTFTATECRNYLANAGHRQSR